MTQKFKFPVGNSIREHDWINHDGRAWIVSGWIYSTDAKTRRPRLLIAPKFQPGSKPVPGPEVLGFFRQGIQLTDSLLERGEIPTGLEKQVEILKEPDITLPNPDASH